MIRTSVLSTLVLILAAGCAEAEPAQSVPPAAKVSLIEAIAAAKQHSPGKATRAEYEQQKDGKWVYDIEVASGATATEVKIDATSGAVLGTRDATRGDNEQDDERHDE